MANSIARMHAGNHHIVNANTAHMTNIIKSRIKRYKKYVSLKNAPQTGFYASHEWRQLRLKVLKRYGWRCMACRSESFIHVDHILPVSVFPQLSLCEDNLQVLCEACNKAKSNDYAKDYRKQSK